MKKMTNKEFKQILEDAGLDFSILGYEGVLNDMSGRYRQLADELRACNCYGAALTCQETADRLYESLKARGYYDDCKLPELFEEDR